MTSQWHGGKGSIARTADKQKYDTNFDKIFNKNKKETKQNESKDAKRIQNP